MKHSRRRKIGKKKIIKEIMKRLTLRGKFTTNELRSLFICIVCIVLALDLLNDLYKTMQTHTNKKCSA